jgi:AAA domain
VLYIAGEGVTGIRRRLVAWKTYHGIARVPGFRVVPEAINLLSRADVERLIAAVLEVQKADGFNPQLVIADTLHRSMPGGDENAAKEMGVVLTNAAYIRWRLGCAFMPVHHSGKDFERGMRGSSGLPGGSDTILRMIRDGNSERATLLVEKQKDGEDGQKHHVISQVIELPLSPGSLKPDSSLVLVADEGAADGQTTGQAAKPKRRADLRGDAGIGFRMLANLIITEGQVLPITDGFPTVSTRGVSELSWRREFYRHITNRAQNAKRMAFTRMVAKLLDDKLIGLCDSLVWLVKDQDQGA